VAKLGEMLAGFGGLHNQSLPSPALRRESRSSWVPALSKLKH